MRENFSKGIRIILKLAKEEAVRLSHSYVGSEHLLLGVIKDNKGKAALILKSIGIDLGEIKLSIEELIKAMQESSKIKLGDYSIVDEIDKKHCDPEKIKNLEKNGNLPWLNNKILREWILNEIDNSMNFSELLEIYR